MGPDSRDRRLDRLPRQLRRYRRNAIRRLVQKHRIGNTQRDRGPRELSESTEADSDGDEMFLDLRLDDGERQLDESATPDAEYNTIAVDLGRRGAFVDGVEQGAADDGQDAREQVPGHVVRFLAHKDAVGHGGRDVEDDVGEQAHPGLQRDVVAHELEVQRDEVDRGEDDGRGAGGGDEGHDHDGGAQELEGEEAFGGGGQEGLLDEEEDNEDAGCDEEADDAAAVPGVEGAAEGDGHESRGEDTAHQDGAGDVDFAEAVLERDVGSGVRSWEQEEIYGGTNSTHEQIDIESEAPA